MVVRAYLIVSKCIFLILSVNVYFSSHIESVFMGNSDSCESVYSFIGIWSSTLSK